MLYHTSFLWHFLSHRHGHQGERGWEPQTLSPKQGAESWCRNGAVRWWTLQTGIWRCGLWSSSCPHLGAPGHDVNPSSRAAHCRDGLTITPEETVWRALVLASGCQEGRSWGQSALDCVGWTEFMLPVLQKREVSRPGTCRRPRDQLPREAPWLPEERTWSQSKGRASLFRENTFHRQNADVSWSQVFMH